MIQKLLLYKEIWQMVYFLTPNLTYILTAPGTLIFLSKILLILALKYVIFRPRKRFFVIFIPRIDNILLKLGNLFDHIERIRITN